jgi:hypothetical protein
MIAMISRRNQLIGAEVDGRIILEWIIKKQDMKLQAKFI